MTSLAPPTESCSVPPWRSLIARALHRNRSQAFSRYFQLATVRKDGRPANRTVVFRGFLTPTNRLQMITDRRSAKFEQLQQLPWGEICWYFIKTREQFRVSGSLSMVTETDIVPYSSETILFKARQQLWQNLSSAARSQFFWPTPGDPLSHIAEEFDAPSNLEAPPSDFCLLLLEPEAVEHLELRGNPQARTRYLQTQHWQPEPLNP